MSGKEYKIEVLMKIVKNKNAVESALKPIIESATDIARVHTEIQDNVKITIKKYLDEIIPSTIAKHINEFFSEEDLNECIKFFTSPAGKKILNQEYHQKNQTSLNDVSREMQKELYQILKPYLPNQDQDKN